MPKRPNTKKIGLFIISGFAFLLIVFATSFGSKIFSGQQLIIMHFDESIKGLNIGAPVVLNGVEIGKVSDITLSSDTEMMKFSISVYADISSGAHLNFKGYLDRKAFLSEMVEKGLRAKLVNQSLLTGQLMIELAIMPDTEAVFRNNEVDDDDIPEIPTVLSPMGQLSQGLQDLHIKENMEKMNDILEKLSNDIIPQTETLLSSINDILDKNKDYISASMFNLNDTLISFKQGAKSFKTFTDYIEQHPEAILYGKAGE